MSWDSAVQVVTVALAVLAIIWNQQRSINGLRGEFQKANSEIRGEFQKANSELRGEFQKANSELRGEFQKANSEMRGEFQKANSEMRASLQKLSDGIAGNSQRLARIEGHLGINVLAKTLDDVSDDDIQPVLPVATGSPTLLGESGKTSAS